MRSFMLITALLLLPSTAGATLLVPTPPPVPWREWLLWGVLVVGVLIVAKMALSLGKAMNKEKQG